MQVSRGDGSVIAVEVAGKPDGVPLLLCHGLADSRLSAHQFADVAADLGLRVIAPDRPGSGESDPRQLRRLADGCRMHVHPGHGHFSILTAAREMLAPICGPQHG